MPRPTRPSPRLAATPHPGGALLSPDPRPMSPAARWAQGAFAVLGQTGLWLATGFFLLHAVFQ
ncbi:MAG: hypothetical protein ABI743_14165, partial [bacterium]